MKFTCKEDGSEWESEVSYYSNSDVIAITRIKPSKEKSLYERLRDDPRGGMIVPKIVSHIEALEKRVMILECARIAHVEAMAELVTRVKDLGARLENHGEYIFEHERRLLEVE